MPNVRLYEYRTGGEKEDGRDPAAIAGVGSPCLRGPGVKGAASFPDTGDAGANKQRNGRAPWLNPKGA